MVEYTSIIGIGGGAFIIGAVFGFIAQKFLKATPILIGIQSSFIAYLDYIGVVEINWNRLHGYYVDIYETITALTLKTTETAEIVYSSSLVGGFIFGLFIGYYHL